MTEHGVGWTSRVWLVTRLVAERLERSNVGLLFSTAALGTRSDPLRSAS